MNEVPKYIYDEYINSVTRIHEEIGSLKASIKRLEKEKKKENKMIFYVHLPKAEC